MDDDVIATLLDRPDAEDIERAYGLAAERYGEDSTLDRLLTQALIQAWRQEHYEEQIRLRQALKNGAAFSKTD